MTKDHELEEFVGEFEGWKMTKEGIVVKLTTSTLVRLPISAAQMLSDIIVGDIITILVSDDPADVRLRRFPAGLTSNAGSYCRPVK